MKPKEPIYPDPTNDDTIDMEIPPADHVSNVIALGCIVATVLMIGIIIGALAFKYLQPLLID